MREIKFRAWDKKNKAMFYPQELIQLDRVYAGYFDDSGCPKTDENIILMQYTGLKDKNGREIYEGDIVKYKGLLGRKKIGIVKYIEEEALFAIIENYTKDTLWSFDLSCADDLEVIGNIYENPELLEEVDEE